MSNKVCGMCEPEEISGSEDGTIISNKHSSSELRVIGTTHHRVDFYFLQCMVAVREHAFSEN